MRLWEANIRKVTPYVPGEQPQDSKRIKLNTNENPYPPSPAVAKALTDMDADMLRLYPDPKAEELVNAIAEYYHRKPEEVFVGVGSDDVLAMCFLTFFNSNKPILFPDITYSFYHVWAELFRIPYKSPKLNEKFELFREDYYTENGGIIFPNPNAPTGIAVQLDFIEDLLQHNPDVIVIVDEAYIDFGAESALKLLDKYENLVVVQTFSKSRSMAGIRIGYAIANEKLIQALSNVKHSYNSYTMNMPSIRLGVEALRDKTYFEAAIKKIVETRERTKQELHRLGFHFGDSMTNFLFVEHECYSAEALFAYLWAKNIYVRYFNSDRIKNYLRITVGTDREMDLLFEALREYKDTNR